jgi:chromosome segregation protein
MYLKSIEIQGFKSFANKIVLQFHNGITGIVGPNGSGKSNIADAVRWVLGEQRVKQLRGESMQDVIFAGTETRKPLGFAYVAITMDNSDHQLPVEYDEVTVSRRLYRSGESEYMINGNICRLKDVSELFYDTGVGKEGYSIIGQGQIDKILSGRPEERRELFDEAAGIVKFKMRKETAEKKLENEKQNLLRVDDILTELEKQVGPLEKQAEKARVFLNRREELKKYDVNVFLIESEKSREQLSETEKNYKIADEQLKRTTDEYQNIKAAYDKLQEQIDAMDAAVEKDRQSIADNGVTVSKLEGEINVLKEQINSAQGNESHLLERVKSITAEIDSRQDQLKQASDQKKKAADELDALTAKSAEVHEVLESLQNEIADVNRQIEEHKNRIIEALNSRATIKSKIGRFDTMLEQISIHKAELNAKVVRARSDEAEQAENIVRMQEVFKSISDGIVNVDAEIKSQEKELTGIREKLTQKDQELQKKQLEYHQERSKLEALSNLTERYEGYGGAVKAVMEQKDTEAGIVGVVADIIKVEKKYETAIETALGGNIQNVVTDNEETAKHMIAYLKRSRAGRVTFLPLTGIQNPQEFKNPEALNETGVIGMADELVKTDVKYRSVAKAMLGRIVVVDNVDNAVKIARKYQYGIRMVTLEGELLIPGGAIAGGAFKNSSNLLGRRREIEELQKQTEELKAACSDIENEIAAIKDRRNEMRLTIENKKADLQNMLIEQNTARMNVEQAREKQNETQEGFGNLKSEQEDMDLQTADIQTQKAEIVNELRDSEELEKGINEKIEELQKVLDEKHGLESETAAQAAAAELEVGKKRQSAEFEQQNLDRISSEVDRYRADLDEVNRSIDSNGNDVEEKKRSISQLEATIAAAAEDRSETQKRLGEEQEEHEKLINRQKASVDDRERLSSQMSELDKEVYRLNAQREKLQAGMETQINYMWDEYEITLSDASSMRDEEMTDLPSMKRNITSLRDQIKKLGDVNVNAIEEFKEVSGRYTFLKNQHDDIVESEKTLDGIITELDAAMRRQFTEKFAQINEEFDKVFKELFGGGKGTLELAEGEDILEAGIQINAQPPGKKLINMMQMSGGEKALTAISLLFAIQNMRPSPFCLLDEIEAALDENNVGRFAKYLHKLTRNTQFIVITHRRGTMENMDRLYGITMQEKGVSTLVSVNLVDKELDA